MATHGIPIGPGGVAGAALDSGPDIQIDTYIDYMCPFCRRFERDNGPAIRTLVDSGRATWVLHPLAFLDRLSNGTDYSTRSSAAAFAVAGIAPQALGAFHAALFANQPREGSDGLTDEKLASLATAAGVPTEQVGHLGDKEFVEAALVETGAALDLGVQGTPTVLATRHGVGRIMWDGETPLPDMVAELENAS
ncbi:MAG: thioredoxin domain-containing protein [Bifidobacteriaceae bacterium]|jgi:protein-disulfide isomerase|nr:thioredoxin domain-containing protein [Bifidobacteriaceae bacterium]